MRSLLLVFISIVCAAKAFATAPTTQQLLDNRLDPRKAYRVLETTHFFINYSTDLEALARDIAPIAENVYLKVTTAMNGEPTKKVHIVLVHHNDEPHYFGQVNPHNEIYLDASLPSQSAGVNEFASWYEWVLTNKLTEVVDLDRRFGFYSFFSNVFGSALRPNEFTPLWMKEGLGVFYESTLTSKGRGGSSLYRMMTRMAVAEGILNDPTFASNDTISSETNTDWPWHLRPSYMGYYLVKVLQDGDSRNLINSVNDSAGSLPFQVDGALAAGSWGSFDALWNETLTQMARQGEAELNILKTSPQTPLQYLTNTGYFYSGLAISSQGQWLAVTRENPDSPRAIVKFDLNGDDISKPKVLSRRSTGAQAAFSKSGKVLAFDQSARRARYYEISDINILDLATSKIISVSPNLRARDPDINPAGTHIVFVKNVAGKNRLIETNNAFENPVDLLGNVGYRRLSTPRYSPDGKKIVVSVHNDKTGGEDLWLIEGKAHQVIVENGAQNIHPFFTADGDKILFSSDRTGVFNIHAFSFKTRHVYQMTHVLGGLFYPVVDPKGRWVYAVSYRGHGYDVARFAWNQALWALVADNAVKKGRLPASEDANSPAAAAGAVPNDQQTDDNSYWGNGGSLMAVNEREYKSSKYLWPQYMRPAVIVRPDTVQVGIDFGTADPLNFQMYDVNIRFDTATSLPFGELYYFNGTKKYAWDISATDESYPLSIPTGGVMRALRSAAALDIPISKDDTHLHWRPGVSYALVGDTMSAPTVNQYAGPMVGLRYNTEVRDTADSFAERGNYVDASASELLGIDGFKTRTTAFGLTARTNIPLLWHHGIHIGVEGGSFAAGDVNNPNAFFTAGGIYSFPYTLGSNFTFFGYDPNSIVSTSLGVGTFLYSIPLFEIERGWDTYPLYFRKTTFALRGQILEGRDIGSTLWSYGAEIHQSLLMAFTYDVDFTVGAYVGMPATQPGATTQVFFMLTLNDRPYQR